MSWIRSRRLRYVVGVVGLLFFLFALLRLLFLTRFSALSWEQMQGAEVMRTVGMGLRFDLRLAILVTLPVMVLAWLPRFNLLRSAAVRMLARGYLALAIAALLLVYIVDFGHYAYLGVRINATVLRFIDDAQISAGMVWQSYPVLWIALGWVLTLALVLFAIRRLERLTLERSPAPISRWSVGVGAAAMLVLMLLGLLGRVESLNLENPVPLRWSDAYFSGDAQIAANGLNPVLFLFDSMSAERVAYDEDAARHYYPLMAKYLGIQHPGGQQLDYVRQQPAQPDALAAGRRMNVVFVMLESLGTSAVGAYGNPLNPTPNLDRIARDGWFFRHFYVPVTGTAKTVWASITGIPDVTRQKSATRVPMISRQHTLINALTGYQKFYMIGGNAGWANINALVQNSIDGVRLYQESDWKSPLVDVWGISDLSFFKESSQILGAVPAGQPFFAYLQTSGNHRPFTIPKDNDGFQPLDLSAEEVERYGSRSLAQFNAVRLLDFNIGRMLELAEREGYLKDTIFVFFGDHNTRISHVPHMAPAFEQLELESTNVPMMIYAPGLLKPRVFEEAVSLVDLLPTVLGMLGLPYDNGGMGRDFLQPAPEGERVVPLVLQEGTFPTIGGVTQHFLLQMQYDGSSPTLHEIYSQTPMENVAKRYPEEFDRLTELTRAMHETSRIMLYRNVRP
ncbi:LTA synthase family protein [Pseudomonas nicosulfuronedens]